MASNISNVNIRNVMGRCGDLQRNEKVGCIKSIGGRSCWVRSRVHLHMVHLMYLVKVHQIKGPFFSSSWTLRYTALWTLFSSQGIPVAIELQGAQEQHASTRHTCVLLQKTCLTFAHHVAGHPAWHLPCLFHPQGAPWICAPIGGANYSKRWWCRPMQSDRRGVVVA